MFSISDPICVVDGFKFSRIRYQSEKGEAIGRAAFIDPEKLILRIYQFYEVINKSFEPGLGVYIDRKINSGPSLPEFVYGEVRNPVTVMLPTLRHFRAPSNIHDRPGKEDANNELGIGAFRILPGESRSAMQEERASCLFACNTIQTNFVGPNGFVVSDGRLICKPWGALALGQTEYKPLKGEFTAFVFDRGVRRRVVKLSIKDNSFTSGILTPTLAITGPRLDLNDPVGGIVQNKKYGPDTPDVVNWDPATTCTSFSAFGALTDGRIVCLSMFEELWGLGHAEDRGITAREMAQLLFDKLNATEGVLGGGSADTQQFIKHDIPKIMVGPKRKRKPEEGNQVQVEGMRGLGAIPATFRP
ncbi:MAG: hypothetical protein H8D67_04180 [Deltaproteobacteria bacterium]|nr:hypothetical protein [Deltaproteobacteria bacterium]